MKKKVEQPSCELAIDIAIQTTKLFIALATSVLAFTVTFSDKIYGGVILCSVKMSWIFLGISIIAGVFLLQKVIGELAENSKVSLYNPAIKWLAVVQNVSFVFGVVWVAFFMLMK